MPRAAKPHGTYRAWQRCRLRPEGACAECLAAREERNSRIATGAKARKRGPAAKPPAPDALAPAPESPKETPLTDEGHVSRVEALKDLLEEQRLLLPKLRESDPSRAYLLMREQRETLREIAELQGNGQVKGVTLADQLAEARARRTAAATAS